MEPRRSPQPAARCPPLEAAPAPLGSAPPRGSPRSRLPQRSGAGQRERSCRGGAQAQPVEFARPPAASSPSLPSPLRGFEFFYFFIFFFAFLARGELGLLLRAPRRQSGCAWTGPLETAPGGFPPKKIPSPTNPPSWIIETVNLANFSLSRLLCSYTCRYLWLIWLLFVVLWFSLISFSCTAGELETLGFLTEQDSVSALS